MFQRPDGSWRSTLRMSDLPDLPPEITSAVASIRIRSRGRTRTIVKYAPNGSVKEIKELPPDFDQDDAEIELTFWPKLQAIEMIGRFRGWIAKEETAAAVDALVTRLQAARTLTMTQTTVTATLPEAQPSASDVIDVQPAHEPEPLPLLDVATSDDDPAA
jgi:hypothetical protein